jgi:alkanesulfonate monooxygenase SsuD/methylene tetrahydromethanopterin reductase-like flavin-dependent oxidoreductase (luciferase family)
MNLGRVGVWALEPRFADPGEAAEAVAELDELGWGALWLGDVFGGDVLADAGRLLDATKTLTLAPGVLNLWAHDPAEVATATAELEGRHPGRFLLGVPAPSGASSPPPCSRERRPVASARGGSDRGRHVARWPE